jgi:hypothetical protein
MQLLCQASLALLAGLAFAWPAQAQERLRCQQQIHLLGEDLRPVKLNDVQRQQMVDLLDGARRYCWVHQEETAMDLIARARKVAGLGPPRQDFDWETVPLESLEQE